MRLKKTALLLLTGLTVLSSVTACASVRTITSRGKTYVPISGIASRYGMTVSEPSSKRIRLQNRWNRIEFETDSRRIWVNETLVWLSDPVRKIGWQWAVDPVDYAKTIEPALRAQELLKRVGVRTVVLDPGHGGKDLGAVSPRGVQEKRVVLDVSKRVKSKLEARGVRVALTRDDDRYLTLSDRVRRTAALKGDLLVSIHANSVGSNRSVRGIETFALALPGRYSTNSHGSGTPPAGTTPGNRHDIANMALSYRIQQNLVKALSQEDRGVKRARFEVLRDAPCPAALVEIGFLSNARDEAMMLDPAGRDRIAQGIADGILAYLADARLAGSK